jgi:hypothetical protein
MMEAATRSVALSKALEQERFVGIPHLSILDAVCRYHCLLSVCTVNHSKGPVFEPSFDQVKYITGRERKSGQINGKSENLNNALRNHIFSKFQSSPSAVPDTLGRHEPGTCPAAAGTTNWECIPVNDLIVVFDADMRARPDFFLKTLEVMADEACQLVLTPQAS